MRFEQFNGAIQAAKTGLGIALLPDVLIENELKNKELKVLFDLQLQQKEAYYLVIPEDKQTVASIMALKSWMLKVANT